MNIRLKESGSILLPTLVLSGMMLALALALTKIVSNELQFSADLLLSERAYFAAESGVEQALLSLKSEPINWVDAEKTILPHSSETTVTVENALDSFSFSIAPKESLRWRFGNDTNGSFSVTPEINRDITVTGNNFANVLQWKFQCRMEQNIQTEMLQARAQTNQISGSDTGTWDNSIDTGQKTIQDFLSALPADARCFLSLTNFGVEKITGTVITPKKGAPPETIVRAKGTAGGREKIIEFEYRQKNLTPFFDFGLLQKN